MNNILWKPSKESIPHTNIFQLKNYINKRYNLDISDYSQLHEWSIQNIDLFWGIMWENLDIIHSKSMPESFDEVTGAGKAADIPELDIMHLYEMLKIFYNTYD